tara:strand:+ start:3594 stop:6257 length:2664 start_codon:yes stop_codon:yes gene_type:complete
MADLNIKSFQREDTPVYNKKAVQKGYETPDEFVADNIAATGQLYDQAGKFLNTTAKIVGHIEKERQNSLVNKLKRDINTDTINADRILADQLPDIEPSKLNTNDIINGFKKDGYSMPSGESVNLNKVEKREGFESLSRENQDLVKNYDHDARSAIEGNIVKETRRLSKSYTLTDLSRQSAEIQNQIKVLTSDPSNRIIKDHPPQYLLDALQTPIAPNGRSTKEFQQHFMNEIRNGNPNVPGAPPGGAKPEDIDQRLELKPEVQKQINQLLNEQSDAVFSAVDTTSIGMEEAESQINSLMQGVLSDVAFFDYYENRELMVKKANTGQYKYTREFDGLGGKNSITYILDPKHTEPMLKAYYNSLLRPPDIDAVAFAKKKASIRNRIQNDKYFNRDKELPSWIRSFGNKGGAELLSFAYDQLKNKDDNDQLRDKSDITESIKAKLVDDPTQAQELIERIPILDDNGKQIVDKKGNPQWKLNKYGEYDFKVKNIKDLVNTGLIDDKEELEFQMSYSDEDLGLGMGAEGGLVRKAVMTPANKRKGLSKITEKDILGLAIPEFKRGKQIVKELYMESDRKYLTTDKGAIEYIHMYGFGEENAPTSLNLEALKSTWETPEVRSAWSNNYEEFRLFTQEVVNKAVTQVEKSKGKIPSYYTNESEMDVKVMEAIKKMQNNFVNYFINITERKSTVEGEELDKKPYNLGLDHNYVQELHDNQMEKTGRGLTSKQWGAFNLWKESNKTLLQLANNYRFFTKPELDAEVRKLDSDNVESGQHPAYYINKPFADIIKKQILERAEMLSSQEGATSLFRNEIEKPNSYWKKEYPGLRDNEILRELQERYQLPKHWDLASSNYFRYTLSNKFDSVTDRLKDDEKRKIDETYIVPRPPQINPN